MQLEDCPDVQQNLYYERPKICRFQKKTPIVCCPKTGKHLNILWSNNKCAIHKLILLVLSTFVSWGMSVLEKYIYLFYLYSLKKIIWQILTQSLCQIYWQYYLLCITQTCELKLLLFISAFWLFVLIKDKLYLFFYNWRSIDVNF